MLAYIPAPWIRHGLCETSGGLTKKQGCWDSKLSLLVTSRGKKYRWLVDSDFPWFCDFGAFVWHGKKYGHGRIHQFFIEGFDFRRLRFRFEWQLDCGNFTLRMAGILRKSRRTHFLMFEHLFAHPLSFFDPTAINGHKKENKETHNYLMVIFNRRHTHVLCLYPYLKL